ncbi:MAG: polyprenol monophosphomannose synthase [Verrucomicrobiales bacterium]|nr:polyprenol monophosphomannose synthase [Verrucomicrobiales bacterium]
MSTRAVVVSPTYNERENLETLVRKVLALPSSIDLLIVDDSSPDGTGQLADEIARREPRVKVLHRSVKDGLGRAYIAGFKWALARGYDFVLEMDADLSHDPADVPRLLEAASQADLALGSRYRDGIRVINWPLKRLMLSLGAAAYVRLITGMQFTDPTGGFKCFRRGTLEAIDLDSVQSNGYSFQIELTHRAWRRGFRVAEVPIIFTDRFHGTSKMSGRIVREALGMVWRLWFQHGLRRSPAPPKPA